VGALFTSEDHLFLFTKRFSRRSQHPGEGGRFAAQKLKPEASQRAARPIAQKRGEDAGNGDGEEVGRAGVTRGSADMGQKTALTRRGFLVEGCS